MIVIIILSIILYLYVHAGITQTKRYKEQDEEEWYDDEEAINDILQKNQSD